MKSQFKSKNKKGHKITAMSREGNGPGVNRKSQVILLKTNLEFYRNKVATIGLYSVVFSITIALLSPFMFFSKALNQTGMISGFITSVGLLSASSSRNFYFLTSACGLYFAYMLYLIYWFGKVIEDPVYIMIYYTYDIAIQEYLEVFACFVANIVIIYCLWNVFWFWKGSCNEYYGVEDKKSLKKRK